MMMKSPDEIKKSLECCALPGDSCTGCPYDDPIKGCAPDKYLDTLSLILQLEATVSEKEKVVAELSGKIGQFETERNQLLKKVEQLQLERDTAVRDCGCFPCQTCEERENGDLCRMCEINGGYRSFHQWRGVQKEG